MDPVLNPYTPNAGAEPQVLIGRDDQLASFDLLLKRIARGRTEQSMIISGLVGVGKTVLLGRFRLVALESNWVVVELEISKHDDDQFRRDIGRTLADGSLPDLSESQVEPSDELRRSRAQGVHPAPDPDGGLSVGLDIEAAEGLADHGDLALDLTDVLVALGEAAQDAGRGVVLLAIELLGCFLDQSLQ